jgi:hypothetical protein
MKRLIIYAMPLGLIAADAAAALPSVWGRMMTEDIGYATARSDGAPIVLVQHRSGGGGRAQINRSNVNRTSVNRNFNANNFQRNVTVNRNVTVAGGHYGPNWGGVAAGVAISFPLRGDFLSASRLLTSFPGRWLLRMTSV